MPWTTCKQIPPFFKGHISRIDTFSGVAHHWAIPKFLKVHYKKSLPLMNCFVFVFQAKRPGNQDRSPCPSRWFLIYGLTFWKHWSFVVCVWLSAPRSKQCLQGLLTADLAFVYLSYEISLHVLLPMTIQLSMSGQPSHPMKSLTSHKAPCRYELAHSKQFFSRWAIM